MIFGPKSDGTYVVEFRTAAGETLAISIPASEAAGGYAATCGTKYGWLTTIATFTGSKPAFCYPRLGHDALRLHRGKPRPAGRNKPSAGRGAYGTRALPEGCQLVCIAASPGPSPSTAARGCRLTVHFH